MRTCNCPGCGANLSFDDSDREFAFCEYCGAKVMFDDYRSTHRVVDEARIHEDETDRMIRMRELDMEEKERERNRKVRMIAYIIAGILVAIGALIYLIADELFGIYVAIGGGIIAEFTFINKKNQKDDQNEARNIRAGLIKLSSDAAEYKKKDFRTVESAYTSIGFQNVSLVNLRDLRMGIVKTPGLVESVTINGEAPWGGKWYHPTASVVITYHGFITDK